MVKIERTTAPPASLEIQKKLKYGSYSEPDVLRQLKVDFHGKCYLCELGPLSDVEVEHLRPHYGRKRKELVFDWNNLFYSCRHCNSMKKSSRYDDHILDCCIVDPEKRLEHRSVDGHVHISAITEDVDTQLTAELIESCFENTNTGVREIGCQTRINDLAGTMNTLYFSLAKYQKGKKARYFHSLRNQLSRGSKFAAFKRFYVRSHIADYPELESLLN